MRKVCHETCHWMGWDERTIIRNVISFNVDIKLTCKDCWLRNKWDTQRIKKIFKMDCYNINSFWIFVICQLFLMQIYYTYYYFNFNKCHWFYFTDFYLLLSILNYYEEYQAPLFFIIKQIETAIIKISKPNKSRVTGMNNNCSRFSIMCVNYNTS